MSSDFWMTTVDLAALLHVSPKRIAEWRVEGAGPPYVKVGPGRNGRVLYRRSDIDEWANAQLRQSTSAVSRALAGKFSRSGERR